MYTIDPVFELGTSTFFRRVILRHLTLNPFPGLHYKYVFYPHLDATQSSSQYNLYIITIQFPFKIMFPILNHLITFLALLLVTSLCFTTQARPLNDIVKTENYIGKAIENMVDGFNIAGIKIAGGPSDGGKGHDIPDSLNFGDIKDSGPAAGGKGHEFVNGEILGERKNSGPAAGGEGHGFTNAQTLGGINDSGPAPGGKGH